MKFNFASDLIKIYLIPISSFLFVVLLVPLVIVPQLNQIAADSKVINNNQNRLTVVETKAKSLENLSANSDELNKKLAAAEKILPVNKAIAPLVLGVQQIAINNGLQVNTIKLQPGKVATSSAAANGSVTTPNSSISTPVTSVALTSTDTEVVFKMEVAGTSDSVQSFLKVLEKGQRLLLLKSFTLQADKGNAYNISIIFSAPYSPLPKITADQLAKSLPVISESDNELLERLSSLLSNNVTSTVFESGPVGVTGDPFH